MPSAQHIVLLSNGQKLLLGPQDRIVKEITINCESPRCASRHEAEKPAEFTFDDGGNFPEAGDSFISLILPERSPSNPGGPRCFCSPQCLKDYLTYAYLAPGPRHNIASPENVETPVIADPLTMADVEAQVGSHDLPEGDYLGVKIESFSHPVIEPIVIGQADGVGE